MGKVVNQMVRQEFITFITKDLNRPTDDGAVTIEEVSSSFISLDIADHV